VGYVNGHTATKKSQNQRARGRNLHVKCVISLRFLWAALTHRRQSTHTSTPTQSPILNTDRELHSRDRAARIFIINKWVVRLVGLTFGLPASRR